MNPPNDGRASAGHDPSRTIPPSDRAAKVRSDLRMTAASGGLAGRLLHQDQERTGDREAVVEPVAAGRKVEHLLLNEEAEGLPQGRDQLAVELHLVAARQELDETAKHCEPGLLDQPDRLVVDVEDVPHVAEDGFQAARADGAELL